jgi:LacI family transcriptional regulator
VTPNRTTTSGKTRRATLQDVASEAGVSFSAVSKVIRGAPGVSPQMRERVTVAIEKLGYRPHAAARAMRGKSYTVGVMIVEMESPFQPEVVLGITDALETTPYQEVVITGGLSPERQKRSIEALIDRQVDGLIVVAPWMEAEWLEELGAKIPTVVVARHGTAATFDTVVDDEYQGARLMVDHLVELGHERIVHTSMPSGGLEPFVLSHTARRHGYEQAMLRHGLTPEIVDTSYSEAGGYEAAIQALSAEDRPSAIFAGADIAALGVLRAAEEMGLMVPEDLTVVGYDNIYVSAIGRIALTTVDQSGQLTGANSARLLLERIQGRTQPAHYVLAPQLVRRQTSGPPPGSRNIKPRTFSSHQR